MAIKKEYIPQTHPKTLILGIHAPYNKTANIELAQVYIRRNPPDYSTAADLMERAGAPDAEVAKLRAEAKKHR